MGRSSAGSTIRRLNETENRAKEIAAMARMRCPRCDTPNTDETARGDRRDYRCRRCGDFSILSTDLERFRQHSADPAKARLVQRDDGRQYLVPEP